MAASIQVRRVPILVPLLLILVLIATQLCSSHAISRSTSSGQNSNQIPNCNDMSSPSLCSQNPKCRWCRSNALDDMCFSKSEALRLPDQVFSCS
ncbi:hypothetical protein L484_004596 [Morus notabilis]|uniref:Uncharacterized protein n=1 Tax=Morus notabilis TaxID=981085 RepID=W9R057_9ROSA|nr:hypothetical protein L484_004596 [Morus notabilis]